MAYQLRSLRSNRMLHAALMLKGMELRAAHKDFLRLQRNRNTPSNIILSVKADATSGSIVQSAENKPPPRRHAITSTHHTHRSQPDDILTHCVDQLASKPVKTQNRALIYYSLCRWWIYKTAKQKRN